MSPPTDLQAAFDQGLLVRPSHASPNLVHLVRALAGLAGVADVEQSPPVRAIAADIGNAEHLVFVLLDGLGMNLVRRLPAGAFLARSLKRELSSTCPSTTACALTSVATAEYANQHGVTGWFTHLPAFGISIATLPFVERITGQPLNQRGIRAEDVLPLAPILPRMSHQPLTIAPAAIANTTYNLYARGGTQGFGYTSIVDAVDQTISRVKGAGRPSYTHVYMPEIDSASHKLGVEHEEVMNLVLHIDGELARLHEALGGRARVVVSADHGLIDVPRADQTLLIPGDPLLDLLAVPPSGDARMPIFHVRNERGPAFREAFCARFGDEMLLVDIESAERLELFGPGPLTALARRRFGDFIGVPFKPAALAYHPPNKPVGNLYLAVHAGLSPQEMEIPLIVA